MKRLAHEVLFESADRYPHKVGIICDGTTMTYAELVSQIRRLSAILRDGGLKNGERVVVLLAGKKDFLVACYAVMAAGGVAVPVHEGCSIETIKEITTDCEPRFLIAGSRDLEPFPDLGNKLNVGFIYLRNGQAAGSFLVSDESMILGGAERQNNKIGPGDGALILYTSGTSGRKKGIFLSHFNLHQASVNINAFMNIDGNIVEFVSVPLTHSFGFGRARCIFLVGGTLVLTNGMLNPITMTRAVQENECTAISAVPSGMAMFFGRFEHLLSQMGPRIRFVELGSSPMPMDHKLKLLKLFPNARICMHFGLTEASRSTFIEFRSERNKLRTVGKASPNVELAILDGLGVSQAAGEEGEIAIRGGHVTSRYWNNSRLTEERISRDGWLRTGDFGSLDEEGYLRLLGRKDEMINMGGIKISPLEIEEPIRTLFPDVELCVVGCPDPRGIAGEIPVLCYVPRETTGIPERGLEDLLVSRLDRFKIPRFTVQLEEFPRTQNQKLKRQEVRSLISNKLSKGTPEGVLQ